MPGSHPYSSSHRPQGSGPPAPEWRVPAAPPRPSSVASPPPPPPSYNTSSTHPPNYGPPVGSTGANIAPVPGYAGVNTATWGVNYNRQQYPIYAPPPLPPRPSSTTGHPSPVPPPVVSSPDHHQPSPSAPSYGPHVSGGEQYQQWTANPPYIPQTPVNSIPHPPPPPPPPPAPPVVDVPPYQHHASPPPPAQPQIQQGWHQSPPPSYPEIPPPSQYQPPLATSSQPSPPPVHAPAHHPTPSFSQQIGAPVIASAPLERPVSQVLTPALHATNGPPLPPKTSPLIIPTGPSALGSGRPSDWEHFSPLAGDVDDIATFRPRRDPRSNVVHELPPNQQVSTPAGELNNHSPTPPPPPNANFTNYAINAEMTQFNPAQSHPVQSPISPGTHQDFQPHRPTRVDSTGSDYSTVSAVANSESIDGLIEAWNKPLLTEDKPPVVQPSTVRESPNVNPALVSPPRSPSPVETLPAKLPEPSAPAKDILIEQGVTSREPPSEPVRTTESPRPQSKLVDRYEDLDSWSQASLERYVAMLRKEAVADSDEERFKLFTTFMAKETKLREILYSIEHDPAPKAEVKAVMQQPAAPESESPAEKPEEKPSPPDDSGLIPVETEEDYFTPQTAEDAGDGSYSPGGRPILPRLHTPQPPSLHRSASNPGGHKYTASHAIADHALRSTSVPPLINETGPKSVLSPLTTNPPQRIYTPFRYTEGPQRGSDKLNFDRPAYQAYSALRQASAESGRVMADAPTETPRKRSSSVVSVQNDPDETFVGLIREKSVVYRKKPPQTSTPPPLPALLRQGKPPGPIEELRTVVSAPGNKQSDSLWHSTVRRDLEKFPNDFNFVRETFKPWEAANKIRRENLEKERIKRQEESEHHIDTLFNSKEIGYADINILEEEFRQSEARTQLEEERGELEDFIANVFNPVDKRLEGEISTLKVHYDSALSQLDRENRSKEEGNDKHSMSHTMEIVNDIHHKLEMRHHKRLEIALDRERRRKKAERRPLVFMGDSAALKKLDSEFDQMEKQNILEAARARDDRANKLMDLFDDAIMRGLGENQTVLDELSAKVTRVDEAAIRSSGLPDAEIEQVLKSVYSLVESLHKDSESILHSFGMADSALNNADYSVSVAEARYSNSEPDVFSQLEAEKKKEDAKILDNLRTKLQSVRVGPAKITNSINDALRALGKTPFPEQPVPKDVIPDSHLYDVSLPNPARPASTISVEARKIDGDPEHRERLRRALEDAKKRNAARQHSSSVTKE
ncbi:hypothetical protein BJY01DRAFT_116145 [Aspergillus pseudoustus]|uniref:Actin interacting protein 3-domain-containing protein n=1 Tax=Aspergillus pseudoustus TaxID=1810923 RepID=A0ABR4L2Y7_9EURO